MRRPKFPNSVYYPAEPVVTKPAAFSASVNDPEDAGAPSQDAFQSKESTSGQNLLRKQQQALDNEALEVAAGSQCAGTLDGFDEDAAFDELWNTNISDANDGLGDGDDYVLCGETSSPNENSDLSHQSLLSLNTVGLQDLVDCNIEPASIGSDLSGGNASLGKHL